MQCVALLYCCTSSTSVSGRRAEKWRGEGIFKHISDAVERRIAHSEADKHNEWMNVMEITLGLRFMQFRGWTSLGFLRIKSKIKMIWHKNAACCILLIIFVVFYLEHRLLECHKIFRGLDPKKPALVSKPCKFVWSQGRQVWTGV